MRVQPALLALALVASAAGALALPAGSEERLASWAWSAPDAGQGCTSADALGGAADAGFSSRLAHAREGASTRYTLRIVPFVAQAGCPELVMTFLSGTPWHARQGWSGGPVETSCGAEGYAAFYWDGSLTELRLDAFVPAACGWGVEGAFLLEASVRHAQPSRYQACAPVALVLCAGATTWEGDETCADGSRTHVFTAGTLHVHHDCAGSEERVVVSPGAGAEVVAGPDACVVRVVEPVRADAPCPGALGAALWSVDWTRVLP